MEEGLTEPETESNLSGKLPAEPAADVPLAVDVDDAMEVDSDREVSDDITQDIERFRQERANLARTLYHQRRADDDTINSTRSLYDSDVEYYDIHGRRYCGEYYMPNDEKEQDRMQILHQFFLYLLGDRLTTVPLEKPTKILDVGTGCGDWAMAMGDEHPEADVIGTDIAKIQPSAVPLNVFFEIDDAEEEGGWTYAENEFDLIHFRTMMGAFSDWDHIYKETYSHLKPGGWVEVMDFDDHKAWLSFFSPESPVIPWLADIAEGSRRAGRPRGIAHLEHSRLTDLGFVDVSTEEYRIPMGDWPEDSEEKKAGMYFLQAQIWGIEALCLRLLTEQMGWDPVQVRRLCEIVSSDIKAVSMDTEKAKGLGFRVRVMKGRKPMLDEEADLDHDGESMSTMRNGENASLQDESVNSI